ncbi:MAG: SoxY-related AACIE arm protein [Reyranella sp.]|nr:SoxY-related AACIE arm protein [Reyranella sp.]
MDRRRFLAGTAATTVAVVVVPLAPATATPDAMAEAIRKVVGTATPTEARVKLDVPPLVENGSTVPLTVSVEGPMTEADYVKAIHVFNEKNPQPNVFSARLGARSGKAIVGTRIKLGDSQRIVAIAETSDGKFWSAGADVIVTLAACLEESP